MITPKHIIHQYLRAYCDRVESVGLTPDTGLIYFFEPHGGDDFDSIFSIREDQGIFVAYRPRDDFDVDHELVDLKAVQEFVRKNYV